MQFYSLFSQITIVGRVEKFAITQIASKFQAKMSFLKRTYIKVLCLCHRNLAEQLPRSQTENVIISMHMGNVIYKNLDLQNIHFSLLFAQFSFKALIGKSADDMTQVYFEKLQEVA